MENEPGKDLYTVKYTYNRLTDEEVWLRAYCAALSNPDTYGYSNVHAYDALQDFKAAFRKEE